MAGEEDKVKFPFGMGIAEVIKGEDWFLMADENGEALASQWNKAKEYLNITGIELEPLVGGDTSGTALVVAPGPSGEQRTAEVASGKYYDFGSGSVLADADKRWKAYWSGSSWSLIDMGELPMQEGVDTVNKGGAGLPTEDAVYRNVPSIFIEQYNPDPDPEITTVGRTDGTTGTSMPWTNINGNAVAYNSSFIFDEDGKVTNIKVVANSTGDIRFAIIEHDPSAIPTQVVTRISLSDTFPVVVGVNSYDVDLVAGIGQRLAIHDTTALIDWEGNDYIPDNTTIRAFVSGTTEPSVAQSSLAMSYVFEVENATVLKSFLDSEYRRNDEPIEATGLVQPNDTGLVDGDTTYNAIPNVVIENIEQEDEEVVTSYGSTTPEGTPPSWTNINGNNIAYSEGFPILVDGNIKKIQYNSLGAGTIMFGVISHDATLTEAPVIHSLTDMYSTVEGINIFNVNIPVKEGQFVAVINLTGGFLNKNLLGSRIVRVSSGGTTVTSATGSIAMSFEVSTVVVNPLKKALDERYLNNSDNSYVPKKFSISELGAVLFPSLKKTDYIHIAEFGQSLSRGGESPYGITTNPIQGNYMYSNYIADFTTEDATLNPLVNTTEEDLIVPCVNVFSQLYRRDVDTNAEFIASSSGQGGISILECMTTRYYRYSQHVDKIKQAVLSEGKTVSCPVIVFVQGESDYLESKPESVAAQATGYQERIDLYKERLIDLKNMMQQTVMEAYGQTDKPLFLVHQPQGQWAHFKDKFVHMAQIQACDENEDMILLGSPYFTPQLSIGHLSTNGYRWWGEMIGKYMYDIITKGRRVEPVRPKRFTILGSKIYIDHLVPKPPLVIDTWTVSDRPGKGFQVFLNDIAFSISSVTLIGSNTVCLDMEVDLEEFDKIQVNYGSPYDSGEFHKGTGEGNLRDSDKWVSMYDYRDDTGETSGLENTIPYRPLDKEGNDIFGKKYPMQNWCCIYSEIIKEV